MSDATAGEIKARASSRCRLRASRCCLRSAAQDAETEKSDREIPPDAQGGPMEQPRFARCRPRRGAVDTPRGPKNVSLKDAISAKGPASRRRLRRASSLFRRRRARHGPRNAHSLVHGEAAGFRPRRLVKRPHPRRRPSVKEPGAIATYVASKSSGMKYSAKLARQGEGDGRVRRGAVLPPLGAVRFRLRHLSCAGGLRIRLQGLPYLSRPEEARKVVGEWPAYRVSNTHVMTMQHRLYDCYWQMRMPEIQLGSDASVALISYLTNLAKGGEIAVPGPQTLMGANIPRIATAVLVLTAGATLAVAQKTATIDSAELTPPSCPHSPPRRPIGSRGSIPMRRCGHARRIATLRRRRSPKRSPGAKRRASHIPRTASTSATGKGARRSPSRAMGCGSRTIPRVGERRQLLRVSPARPPGAQLRDARPSLLEYGKTRNFNAADAKAAYEKIYDSQASFPCSNMPRFGTNKVLTIEQIQDWQRC